MKRHSSSFSGRLAVSRGLACIANAAVIVVALGAHAQDADDEVARLQTENAALRQQVVALQEELAALRAQLAELQQNNDQLENQTQQLEQETEQLQQLAGVATDGRIESEQAARIKRSTDPQTQQAQVSFGPEPLDVEGAPGDVYFSVAFTHPADAPPAAVESVRFFIQAYRTGKHFQGRETVGFMIDGERVAFSPDDYKLTSRRSGLPGKSRMDRSDETVTFNLDRATFARLSAAETLAVRSGSLRLTFDRDDLAALRAVQRRLVDQAPTP